jgi:hypothetical protein
VTVLATCRMSQAKANCFVAPVARSGSFSEPQAGAIAQNQYRSLPALIAEMIGRNETVQKVSEQLLSQRFVTITGPGGIGKTTVAIAVGQKMLSKFDDYSFTAISGDSKLCEIARSCCNTTDRMRGADQGKQTFSHVPSLKKSSARLLPLRCSCSYSLAVSPFVDTLVADIGGQEIRLSASATVAVT